MAGLNKDDVDLHFNTNQFNEEIMRSKSHSSTKPYIKSTISYWALYF